MTGVLAHGLVQRADLPIPPVVFAWACAAVLVVSFVALAALWPTPRYENQDAWRPLFGLPDPVERAGQALGLALLALVVWAGFAGDQGAQSNFAPTFVYVVFWVGLVFASLLFGNVFRLVNPWLVVRFAGRRAYPAWLGRWPAAIGLLVFTWTELVVRYADFPDRIAICALLYSAVTWAGMFVFGSQTWAARAETFSVYFGLFARLSIFERRDGVVGRRPLLSGLSRLEPTAGTVAVVAVMIGTVTFDGLSQGNTWRTGIGQGLNDLFAGPFSAETATYLADTVGLLAGPLLIAGFYWLGVKGAESVGGGLSAERLRGAFVHSLVPIALVYAMAHYLTALVFQGQAISYLASDPLSEGWNLFGTATWAINYDVLSQTLTWYLQVGFVVVGHIGGLVLAHDRALAIYPDAREAVRSQYWMLAVMVGFTSLALWLLSQAN
ncbi:MAG: fenitrothion hydrolase [Solirubrobacteraceae bacterium]